jgi:hypothetical protein
MLREFAYPPSRPETAPWSLFCDKRLRNLREAFVSGPSRVALEIVSICHPVLIINLHLPLTDANEGCLRPVPKFSVGKYHGAHQGRVRLTRPADWPKFSTLRVLYSRGRTLTRPAESKQGSSNFIEWTEANSKKSSYFARVLYKQTVSCNASTLGFVTASTRFFSRAQLR